MIIQSETDPRLYATVDQYTDGVRVAFYTKTDVWTVNDRQACNAVKLLAAGIFEQPYHVLLNRVYEVLN